jgi:hypothetical protein
MGIGITRHKFNLESTADSDGIRRFGRLGAQQSSR